jgi:hypothetical protein
MTSRVWYVVAALLFVGGGAGAAWTLWSGIASVGDLIVRIEVPGSGELTLDTPGTYTIYHEQEDVTDGHISVVQSLDGMTVTVTDESTATKLFVNTPNMSSSYTVGDIRVCRCWRSTSRIPAATGSPRPTTMVAAA